MEERIRAGEWQLVLPPQSGTEDAIDALFTVPPAADAPAAQVHTPNPPGQIEAITDLLRAAGLGKRDAKKIAREQ
jgi:hypothetical protein